ncbi:MAG TPA: sensor domain-containing diguanylate cyclase [Solirubrobacteraceae bacterium]|nr:sensor domain-containing diguanylate cyclase [Solirubrobacteraceae bacterium]
MDTSIPVIGTSGRLFKSGHVRLGTSPPASRGIKATAPPVDGWAMNPPDLLGDPERLAVLRNLAILDTPAEPDYDDIARLASACCRSPIAAVNFVDAERHWTKAIVGLEGGQGASVANDLSFCAATVATPGGLLRLSAESLSDDWRSHPFVTGPPFLRYYLGAAIVVSGQPIGVVCVFGDESRDLGEGEEQALVALARQASAHLELRQRNTELRKLAVSDPLTGLANRTLLFNRLELAIEQRRRTGAEVGVLFCDVDDFKLLNDRLGHGAGDRLLCRVADRLRMATRATDTVSRFGGDEFVVLCPGLDDLAEFELIVERINRALNTSEAGEELATSAPTSIGAVLIEPDETAVDVLRRADEAMYAEKVTSVEVARGQNRLRFKASVIPGLPQTGHGTLPAGGA